MMNNILPIKSEIDKMNDTTLLKNFYKSTPPYGKVNYYAVFAKRFSKFKDLLKEEILSNENNSQSVMGIIKVSWLPLISILCYIKDENAKKNFVSLARDYWGETNFQDFKIFLSKDDQLNKYFEV